MGLVILYFILIFCLFVCVCVGNPTPEVTWWQEQRMVDKHSEFRHPEQGVRNVLQLERLSRSDLLTSLSCQAANTQLSLPLTRSVQIELNCKSTSSSSSFYFYIFYFFLYGTTKLNNETQQEGALYSYHVSYVVWLVLLLLLSFEVVIVASMGCFLQQQHLVIIIPRHKDQVEP